MKRAWSTGTTVLACALTATLAVHAQQGNTSSPSRGTDKEVTVTGCLKGSDLSTTQSPAQAAAAAEASGAAQSFVLTNAAVGAQPGGGSGSISSAPVGSGTTDPAARVGATAPAAPVTADGKTARGTYVVRGDAAELSRRVGQQVQISGHLIDTKSTTGTPTPGTQRSGSTGRETDRNPGATGTTTAMSRVQEIQATTVRMIGTICATD